MQGDDVVTAASLRKVKEEAQEVWNGDEECGLVLAGFQEFKKVKSLRIATSTQSRRPKPNLYSQVLFHRLLRLLIVLQIALP